jgi:hypothetical protein
MASKGSPRGEDIGCVRVPCRAGRERVCRWHSASPRESAQFPTGVKEVVPMCVQALGLQGTSSSGAVTR